MHAALCGRLSDKKNRDRRSSAGDLLDSPHLGRQNKVLAQSTTALNVLKGANKMSPGFSLRGTPATWRAVYETFCVHTAPPSVIHSHHSSVLSHAKTQMYSLLVLRRNDFPRKVFQTCFDSK